MSNIKVSVVMGVRGGGSLLGETLDSVLRQVGVSWELVLVVDGSLDKAAELDLERRLREGKDNRIHVLRRPPEGLTRALIAGCEVAKGEYIARIDVGDRMADGRLSRQAEAFDRYPSCVLTACATQVCGPDWEPLWVTQVRPEGRGAVSMLSSREEACLGWDVPHHGATMFRRQAYRLAGGYRPDFYYGQDWDLWYRLAEHGDYCPIPDTLYTARLFPSGISMRKWRQQQKIAACSKGAFLARRQGADEGHFLEKARAIRPVGNEKVGLLQRLSSGGDGSYFIGEALRRHGYPQARRYLCESIGTSPLQVRGYVRLLQSFLK